MLRHALLLFLALQLAAPLLAARPVARITSGDWPPYLSQDLPHNGVAARIISEAFAEQGIDVNFGFFPWRRTLALARAGEWDGTAVWLKNEDRERDFYISAPIIRLEYMIFHLQQTRVAWSDVDDLAKYRIGITNDYFYGPVFSSAAKKGMLTIESVSSDEQNFRKLLRQRIDLFPMDRIVGQALLQQYFSPAEASRITTHPKPLYSESLHLLLSKKVPDNKQRILEFNQGLEKLRASGRLNAYLNEASVARPAAN